jgi:hypothetical protein
MLKGFYLFFIDPTLCPCHYWIDPYKIHLAWDYVGYMI